MSKSVRSKAQSPTQKLGGVSVAPCGDDMILVDFSGGPDSNRSVRAFWAALQSDQPDFCREAVAAVSSLCVVLRDEFQTQDHRQSCCQILLDLAQASIGKNPPAGAEKIIPVCYDQSLAPDLDRVASLTGLSTAEVVSRHQAGVYLAQVMGFMPGFAYMSGLDAALSVARLPTPRPVVPAGALGITGDQCAVYPSATPGGWNLIGRSPLRLFDPQRQSPSFLGLGDTVRFESISLAQFDRLWAKR
jgi:inhibitor of KinA